MSSRKENLFSRASVFTFAFMFLYCTFRSVCGQETNHNAVVNGEGPHVLLKFHSDRYMSHPINVNDRFLLRRMKTLRNNTAVSIDLSGHVIDASSMVINDRRYRREDRQTRYPLRQHGNKHLRLSVFLFDTVHVSSVRIVNGKIVMSHEVEELIATTSPMDHVTMENVELVYPPNTGTVSRLSKITSYKCRNFGMFRSHVNTGETRMENSVWISGDEVSVEDSNFDSFIPLTRYHPAVKIHWSKAIRLVNNAFRGFTGTESVSVTRAGTVSDGLEEKDTGTHSTEIKIELNTFERKVEGVAIDLNNMNVVVKSDSVPNVSVKGNRCDNRGFAIVDDTDDNPSYSHVNRDSPFANDNNDNNLKKVDRLGDGTCLLKKRTKRKTSGNSATMAEKVESSVTRKESSGRARNDFSLIEKTPGKGEPRRQICKILGASALISPSTNATVFNGIDSIPHGDWCGEILLARDTVHYFKGTFSGMNRIKIRAISDGTGGLGRMPTLMSEKEWTCNGGGGVGVMTCEFDVDGVEILNANWGVYHVGGKQSIFDRERVKSGKFLFRNSKIVGFDSVMGRVSLDGDTMLEITGCSLVNMNRILDVSSDGIGQKLPLRVELRDNVMENILENMATISSVSSVVRITNNTCSGRCGNLSPSNADAWMEIFLLPNSRGEGDGDGEEEERNGHEVEILGNIFSSESQRHETNYAALWIYDSTHGGSMENVARKSEKTGGYRRNSRRMRRRMRVSGNTFVGFPFGMRINGMSIMRISSIIEEEGHVPLLEDGMSHLRELARMNTRITGLVHDVTVLTPEEERDWRDGEDKFHCDDLCLSGDMTSRSRIYGGACLVDGTDQPPVHFPTLADAASRCNLTSASASGVDTLTIVIFDSAPTNSDSIFNCAEGSPRKIHVRGNWKSVRSNIVLRSSCSHFHLQNLELIGKITLDKESTLQEESEMGDIAKGMEVRLEGVNVTGEVKLESLSDVSSRSVLLERSNLYGGLSVKNFHHVDMDSVNWYGKLRVYTVGDDADVVITRSRGERCTDLPFKDKHKNKDSPCVQLRLWSLDRLRMEKVNITDRFPEISVVFLERVFNGTEDYLIRRVANRIRENRIGVGGSVYLHSPRISVMSQFSREKRRNLRYRELFSELKHVNPEMRDTKMSWDMIKDTDIEDIPMPQSLSIQTNEQGDVGSGSTLTESCVVCTSEVSRFTLVDFSKMFQYEIYYWVWLGIFLFVCFCCCLSIIDPISCCFACAERNTERNVRQAFLKRIINNNKTQ